MLLDGPHLLADALTAGIRIREAAIAADAVDDREIAQLIAQLDRARVETVSAIAPVMAALSPVRSPSAVVAVADQPAADGAMFEGEPMLVVATDIQDPGNLGAIVRVSEAAGATGVIASGASADPFGWKALRGSMGSTLRLPVAVDKERTALHDLRRRGCRVVATSPRHGQSLFAIDLKGPVAFVVGGEGAGLPDDIVATADAVVTIPMQPPVESLNAAITVALLVYEARRQRSS
jgi:TrmH family RNA methyltransferase